MSLNNEVYLKSEVPFYYRDVENDFPETRKEDDSFLSQSMRLASVALPIVSTLCKSFGLIANWAGNAMRTITSFSEIGQVKTTQETAIASLKTAVAASALVLTFISPVHSILLITGEDIVIHMGHLYEALKGADYEKAFQSLAHIVTSALYFSLFLSHSLELSVIAFSAQILLGFYTALQECNKGYLLEGAGQLVLAALRIQALSPQIKMVQFKWELEKALKELPDYHFVGELGEEWQIGSDHLPIGAQIDKTHIGSWNVLNGEYMEWVTDKNSQGINHSMISRLNRPSSVMKGLTVREVVIIHQLVIMTERSERPFEILGLQECSPQFLQGLALLLPNHIGIIYSDPSLMRHDQNVVLYNKNRFHFVAQESSLNVLNVYKDQPGRGLMDLVFQDQLSGEKVQMINSHVLGDPNLPGRFHFAEYVISHKKSGYLTVALGDMNFIASEMQNAFEVESKKRGIANSFENPIRYYTNIGPDKIAKCIDHLWISPGKAQVEVRADLPDEVLPGLQKIVNLLLPNSATLQSLDNQDVVDYERIMNLRWNHYLEELKVWENREKIGPVL